MSTGLKMAGVVIGTIAEDAMPAPYNLIGTKDCGYRLGLSVSGSYIYVFQKGKPTQTIHLGALVQRIIEGTA